MVQIDRHDRECSALQKGFLKVVAGEGGCGAESLVVKVGGFGSKEREYGVCGNF